MPFQICDHLLAWSMRPLFGWVLTQRAIGDKRDDMDDVLLDIVLKRLAESPLAEQETNVLLAALDGEESLSAQLGGQAGQRPVGDLAGVASPRPAAAFLRSLTVSGFRGIGKPATLSLAPGPGLTLVVGRNGSGKSSFAEALEVLLTGEPLGEAVGGLAPRLAEHAPAGRCRDHRGVPGAGHRRCHGAADLAEGRGFHQVVGFRAVRRREADWPGAAGLVQGAGRLPSVPVAQRARGVLRQPVGPEPGRGQRARTERVPAAREAARQPVSLPRARRSGAGN